MNKWKWTRTKRLKDQGDFGAAEGSIFYSRLLIGMRRSHFQMDISPWLSEVSNFSRRFSAEDVI